MFQARRNTRKAERDKRQAENREARLTKDLEKTQKECHKLEAKLLHDTHELELVRKQAKALAEALAEAEAQLPQIVELTRKLAGAKRTENVAVGLKDKLVRKVRILKCQSDTRLRAGKECRAEF